MVCAGDKTKLLIIGTTQLKNSRFKNKNMKINVCGSDTEDIFWFSLFQFTPILFSPYFGGGGQVNVDCRFCPILVVESTVFFNKSCRFVDRICGQKNCRL